jgi:hypothetical protein
LVLVEVSVPENVPVKGATCTAVHDPVGGFPQTLSDAVYDPLMELKFDEAELSVENEPSKESTEPNSLIDSVTFEFETVPLNGATPEQLCVDVGWTARLPETESLLCSRKPLSDCAVVLLFG